MSCLGLYQADRFFQQWSYEHPWVLVSHVSTAAAVGSGRVMWDPSQLLAPQLDVLVGYRPLHASPALCQNLNVMIWSPILPKHPLLSLCELPGSAPTAVSWFQLGWS